MPTESRITPSPAGSKSAATNHRDLQRGDATYASVTSQPLVVTAEPSTTSLTVVPSTIKPTAGLPFTVTVNIAVGIPPAGTVAPTGKVTLNVDGLPTATASFVTTGGVTTATFPSVTINAAGDHPLQAVYAGDANYAASTAPPVTVSIGKGATVTEGITVLTKEGKLTEETIQIIQMAALADVVLATAHLSEIEIRAVAQVCRDNGGKCVVTHAFFPRHSIEFLAEMAELGAVIEISAVVAYPMARHLMPGMSLAMARDNARLRRTREMEWPYKPGPRGALAPEEMENGTHDLRQFHVGYVSREYPFPFYPKRFFHHARDAAAHVSDPDEARGKGR
jgi:hypothetical protein